MKILITELGDFRIMDDVARKWGITTPVITQPVKELPWCIACDISDFNAETVTTLVGEYDDMRPMIGIGTQVDTWKDEGIDDFYDVYKLEYDGYTILYVESQEEELVEEDIVPTRAPYKELDISALEALAHKHNVAYVPSDNVLITRMRLIMAIRQNTQARQELDTI